MAQNTNIKRLIKTYKVEFSTITPIHIGMGEDYVPVDYVILQENSNNKAKYYFYFINREKFINYIINNNKYKEFLLVCEGKYFMNINRYISDNFIPDMIDWRIVVSKSVF